MRAKGILVKVRGNADAFAESAATALGASGSGIERILTVPAGASPIGLAAAEETSWFRIREGLPQNAWDRAHSAVSTRGRLGLAGGSQIVAAEPDFEQAFPIGSSPSGAPALAAAAAPPCTFQDQDGSGGRAIGPGIGWSTGPGFSQLAAAAGRVSAAQQATIVVAHLDTGYDPGHPTNPPHLDLNRQRNFVAGQPGNNAADVTQAGGLNNPGHGPATLAILAGGAPTVPEWAGHARPIGGAPFVTIVPIRIADSVVHFTTGTMVQGFDYATSIGAHILSMSMGGLSSDALVDAVNVAYESGVFMVAAAGNSYSWIPSPTSIVFPARYRRVLAACGVMADGRAYWGLDFGTMQGNHGPPSKMETALGAYAPNIAWAERGCAMVDMNGAGTSSATPQIAAVAALWMAQHWATLQGYPGWARIEATRQALFKSAAKRTATLSPAQTKEFLGMGVMQASDALNQLPLAVNRLTPLAPAQPSWPWLDLLTDGGVSFGPVADRQLPMLRLELTQMAQRLGALERAMPDPDRTPDSIPPHERNRYLERALEEGNPSKPLRRLLETLVGVRPATEPRSAPPIKRKPRPPAPPPRRLRVYSLDPSLAQSNDFFAVNETTLKLPWDDDATRPLQPGPVGEYLEVVDVDPASNRFYAPVDLNEKTLLAQDGLAPSEGNPKFHQQMVYAVGMQTIGTFERALGRKALWAPRWDASRQRQYPVPRLRLYPHALRAENAYYSPDKRALLFGYFQSADTVRGLVAPGTMVFTCLSSDIIAHEMSHALLDGLHRRFTEASNPDVPAFHEAFADIVAVFQHFTFRNLVRFEIGRAHGELSAATLLSGLARQFGEGSGRSGPLRNYTDPKEGEHDYIDTEEAHDRGSILVFAVYDAFLKIVSRRSADLIRLATGGTGVLPAGALHPDLVERLTDETCAVARHILNVCIRALDYCPAVDITFGEYLRGLVTADVDVMPDDPWGYRVALIEAFRNRGILPRDVKTISEETLTWNTYFDVADAGWIEPVIASLDLNWNLDRDRDELFQVNEDNRWAFWRALGEAFKAKPQLMAQFGLQANLPRYDDDGKERSTRNRDRATTFEVYGIRPTRRVASDGSFRTELVAIVHQRQPVFHDPKDPSEGFFWFRGGATIIIDPRPGRVEIRYSIVKNSNSIARRERQRKSDSGMGQSALRSLYFAGEEAEPFAMMHSKLGGY